ncbi:alpha/beta hydrolase [Amycolatopsis antarctica]|uniref:Alpha/beta hydrolase n=1 Tax=Amycolatopsis antarctica TaxID=1854586 RepID=A0A263D876_9PSEU|nr:alpha/beta hydrolase [Amycolatopsis antarctica]OZM74734.1 alpha/beta hydrolase [Amycolatopsis antarctica]
MPVEVIGAGGVRLALRVAGPPEAPPIVLLHGWAQSSRAWDPQFAGDLAARFRLIAVDLRGHGGSGAPEDGYDDPRNWAGDLAAVLAFSGAPATVVGWSYGGLVIADHLRVHGTAGLAGIVLAGAITEIGRGRAGGRVGRTMRDCLPGALSADPEVALPALAGFHAGAAARPLPGPLAQALLGAALSVPPRVRAALFAREVDSGDVLAAVDVPALVVHGTLDTIVDPSAGEYAAGKIPGAELRWFESVGHLPFAEAAPEFDSALARFAGVRSV